MEAAYITVAKSAIWRELQQGLQPFVYLHVVESIRAGCSPDAIGEFQEEVEVEALVLERRSDARDRALGHFVSLLHHYLARQPESESIDDAIETLQADLIKDQPPVAFSEFRLDTSEINDYVEEQKGNAGLLAGDFAWSTEKKCGSNVQWNVEFKRSLDLTRQAYVDACQRFQHRFDLGAQADLALVQLLSNVQLAQLLAQTAAKPRHIPAPPSAPTSSFWSQRIGSTSTIPIALPQFDEDHLLLAGQRFRTASIEHLRARQATAKAISEDGKDVISILSQAQNPDTNPQRLIQSAQDIYDSLTSSTHDDPSAEEITSRKVKDLLSSALRVLGLRRGERNMIACNDAHNLCGHINLRLATLKPRSEVNYLNRAVANWTASIDLNPDQPDISKQLVDVKARLQSRETHGSGAASADSIMSGPSSQSGAATAGSLAPSITAIPRATPTDPSDNAPRSTGPSATARSGDATEPSPSKPKEKTILESPFFRADLVTGLMVHSLLALPFPHKALRETLRMPSAAAVASASQDHVTMLDRLAKSHQLTTKSLSAENKAQVKDAIKAVSAVLALPDIQQAKRDDPPEKVLRRTSLRLVLGTLFLLLNDFVRAQNELDLVSDALKPNTQDRRRRQRSHSQNKQGASEASQPNNTIANANDLKEATTATKQATVVKDAIAQMQARVQGEALFLLARICWVTNKVQEAAKFFRWFVKWYSDQQEALAAEGSGLDVPELDLAWWDKLLVVTKTQILSRSHK